MKTVTFVLPGRGLVPVGGFKVVYEYANGLARRGWHVQVVHPGILTAQDVDGINTSFFRRGRCWLAYQRRKITKDYRPDAWFNVSSEVELLCTKTPQIRHMPKSDAWIATAWPTAPWVATYRGAGLYLIQHFETWCGTETEVVSTWRLPLRKIVISRWLEDIGRSLDEKTEYIPNGLDFRAFGLDTGIGERDPCTVAMLYHTSQWKGSADGLQALYRAKQLVPGLRAFLFGLFAPPPELPSWIRYYQNPPQQTLREIYNRAAVFLAPSWTEGWPLPPAEALQCGAALVATDIGGHREYAHHAETALLSPPNNPDALASNLVSMINDQDQRLQLARKGHAYIQQFTWDRAVTSFEASLEEALAEVHYPLAPS